MNISKQILEWLKECPYIGDISLFDINLLQSKDGSVALFKQPSVTVHEFIDGSKQITEYYYFLFSKSAQIDAERIENEEYLRKIEDWIGEQEFAGKYPDIGYPVDAVSMGNGYYMISFEGNEAKYQLTLGIQYRKDIING